MNCVDGTVNLAQQKCPVPDQVLNMFTEIILCPELEIPPQKPDKELITNTLVNVNVHDVEVIEFDLGDGGGTRKKVVVSGKIRLGLEYSAAEPEQQVHFAHFDIPFQGIIGYRPCVPIDWTAEPVDPTVNRGLLPADFDIDQYHVNVCLEHEQYHQLSPRKIKAVLVLLIWLEANGS